MLSEHTTFAPSRDAAMTPTEQAYAELQQAYDHYNRTLFDGQLPGCLLTFQRAKKTMGYFAPARWVNQTKLKCDEIALNPEYFATSTLMEILQTLCHECCHQWQLHYGKPSRQCYHNREWASKMEEIGLMPSDTGLPGGKMVGQAVRDYCVPGGRFEQATVALLQSGFLLSWKDRYPVHGENAAHVHVIGELVSAGVIPSEFSSPGLNTASAMDSDELSPVCFVPSAAVDERSVAAAVATQSNVVTSLAEPIFPSRDDLTPAYRDTLINAYSMPVKDDELILERKKPRGQRATYKCPACDCRVWGKSGLKIVCGACTVAYEELAPREGQAEE